MRPTIKLTPAKADLTGLTDRFFNAGELDALIHLVASVHPKTVIEFGCHEGRAAAAILRNVPGIEAYVGIDVVPGYVTIKECQRKEVPDNPGRLAQTDTRFRLILRPGGSFDLRPSDLPPCDAVFIDADHSRAGVRNDYALAKEVIRPGGIIIFHDDNKLPVVEVSETLDELYTEGVSVVHVEGTWLAFAEN